MTRHFFVQILLALQSFEHLFFVREQIRYTGIFFHLFWVQSELSKLFGFFLDLPMVILNFLLHAMLLSQRGSLRCFLSDLWHFLL